MSAAIVAQRAFLAEMPAPEGECYPREVEQLVRELQGFINNLDEDMRSTGDRHVKGKYEVTMLSLQAALTWLPDAAKIPVAWTRFIAPEHRNAQISFPPEVQKLRLPGVDASCVGRSIVAVRCIFDTNNPIEIARIRYHMRFKLEQGEEELEPWYIEDFSHTHGPGRVRPNEFMSVMPEEQLAHLRSIGVLLPNYR